MINTNINLKYNQLCLSKNSNKGKGVCLADNFPFDLEISSSKIKQCIIASKPYDRTYKNKSLMQ